MKKVMKWAAVVFLCTIAVYFGAVRAFAADTGGDWERLYWEQAKKLDTSDLDRELAGMDKDVQELLRPYDWRKSPVAGKEDGKIINRLFLYFTGELRRNLGFFGQLIILVVLTTVLYHFQDAFGGEGAAKVAFYVCYLTMLILVAHNFWQAMNIGRETVEAMSGFLYAILPVLLSLLGAAGGVLSIQLLQPVLLAGIVAMTYIAQNFVFPLFFLSGMLGLFSQFSSEVTVKKLAGLLRETGIWLLGLTVCVFLAILSARGINAALVDGLSLKTAKFMTGSLVPVIGKNITDAMDLVAGCALVLKSAVGFFGMMAIFLVCAFPLLRLAGLAFLYRLAGAILQPAGDQQINNALQEISISLQSVIAVVFVVTLMFIAIITFVVALGSFNMAVR